MKYIRLDDFYNLKDKQIKEILRESGNQVMYDSFAKLGFSRNFIKAEGTRLFDEKNESYLDVMSGFGAMPIGYNIEKIMSECIKYMKYPNMCVNDKSVPNAILFNNLKKITNGLYDRIILTNSGTETVEEAIKLANIYNRKGKILYFTRAYHGKTMGSLSAMGTYYSKIEFNRLDWFIEAPFNDVDYLHSVCYEENISAIIFEYIQGEGGVVEATLEFIMALRKYSNNKDIILIGDEIQTGLGRTGRMFAYEHYGIEPDLLCISKALGGGVVPIGALLIKKEFWNSTYKKFQHASFLGSTFGGNSLSSIIAIKTLEILTKENLISEVMVKGDYALRKLKKLEEGFSLINQVRGKGLMIGIEFNIPELAGIGEILALNIVKILLEKYKILTYITANNNRVIRFEPSFLITYEEIDYFVESLQKVVEDYGNLKNISIESIKNISKNILKK